MTLYMEVTQDKYQLPLAVADSLRELARMRGDVTYSGICKHIGRNISGYTKYVKVEVDDFDLEE